LNTTIHHQLIHWDTAAKKEKNKNLLGEEPLSVRIQGNPYSVMMRTPGDEIPLVAGFCLTEGIIDSADDYISLAFCDGEDTNVIAVTLKPDRRNKIAKILDRRGFISQSSCGLCGKEIVEDLFQIIKPLEDDLRLDSQKALACLENIIEHQPLRQKTRAAHAAVLYSSNFEFLAAAEDVGRHNALDKVIGKLLLNRSLDQACLLILSSRISYELVQKAARARIPIIVALSRPTALAVKLASALNITLAAQADDAGCEIVLPVDSVAAQEIKAGAVNGDIVLNLDFAPTFLDFAGVAAPADMQGRSFRALLKGETPREWRTSMYYHYYEYPGAHAVKRHYGIRTKRYKLIHFYYDIDAWELYDLGEDPHELNNLYGNPAYDAVVKQLKTELERLRKQYGDSDELAQKFLHEYCLVFLIDELL